MSAKVTQMVHDLVSQGRFDEAHAVLLRWVAQSPDDPEALLQSGNLCYVIGKFADAEQYLRMALAKNDSPEGHYSLGLTLTKLGRPEEAMQCFREACERKEGFATGHLHWGLALLQMSSYRGALGQFRQALKLNPRLVAAAYQAGIAAHQLGQYADSVEFFAEACEKDSSLAEAFNGLGVSLAALNQGERALKCFDRAWELNPNLAIIQRNWAAALVSLGQFDEAAKHYQTAVQLSPKLLEAKERALIYNDWGVNLFQQGRLEEAAERLLYAVDIDSSSVDARLNLGIVKNALQEYEQAADSFEKALELDAELPATNMHLGISYFLLGQYQEALARLAKAREKLQGNETLDLWIGYANMAQGNREAAEASFRQVVTTNPHNVVALDALGNCFMLQERHLEAIELFKQCLKVNNQFGLAHIHLARALESCGRDSEALLEYRVAVQKDPECLVPEREIIEMLTQYSHFDLVMSKSQKLLQFLPDDEDALLSLALALRAQNRLDEATEILVRLLKQHSNNGPAHVLLGHIFLAQGQLLEADERFRNASLVWEGDVALYYGWGKTLALLGMHELALEKFFKANEIDPYDSDTYEAWGATLKALGRFQEAADVFKRAADYL